ncbi:MAG: glycosyltransferase family 39 protein, partial [Saprospiraceae bacterium]
MSKRKITKQIPQPTTRKQPAAQAQARIKPAFQLGPAWVGLLAAALGFVLYINTFGHIYCLDDYSVIKENWVTKGGLKNLGLMFTTEYRFGAWNSPGSLYRPFSLLIFSLQWQISPDNPSVGHIMNAVMYGLSGWLLWITWRRVLAAYHPVVPALAVLFFIAHPVHTEVVANIKSLDEILALFFCTAALYGVWRYFETQRGGWLAAAVFFYTVALFSKESSITYLALFPLTIWFFTDRSLSQNLRVSALFLAPAVFFLGVRHSVLSAQAYQETYSGLDNFIVMAEDRATQLASAFMMCGLYLKTLLFPHPLVSDLGFPQMKPVTFADWRALAGFFAYAGMFVWALLNLRKKHLLSFAILFSLIAFSLFSNVLMLIGTSYGERVLYVPSWGFALGIAGLLALFFKIKPETDTDPSAQVRNPNGKGTLVWGISIAILAVYSLLTVLRNPAWYTSYTLYKADVPHSPNCAKLNYHLGIETIKEGMNEETGQVFDSTWV